MSQLGLNDERIDKIDGEEKDLFGDIKKDLGIEIDEKEIIKAKTEALKEISEEIKSIDDMPDFSFDFDLEPEVNEDPEMAEFRKEYGTPLAGRVSILNEPDMDYYPDFIYDNDFVEELKATKGEFYDSGNKLFSNKFDALMSEITYQRQEFIDSVKSSLTPDEQKIIQKQYRYENRRDWMTALAEDFMCVSEWKAKKEENVSAFGNAYDTFISDIRSYFHLT